MTLSKSSGGLGPTIERFADEYAIWNQVVDPAFDARANHWFRDFQLTPIGNYLAQLGETPKTLSLIEHWLDDLFKPEELLVLDGLVHKDTDLLGSPMVISESTLGQKTIEALDAAGIPWRYATLPTREDDLWPLSVWPMTDLPMDDTRKLEIFYKNDEQYTVLQYVQILRDKRGNETAIWFAPQLAASRPMHQITRWYVNNSETGGLEFDEVPPDELGRVFNIGEWPEQIVLPVLFKKLFALAEAGGLEFSDAQRRSDRFAALASGKLPEPILFFETKYNVAGTWDSDESEPLYTLQELPHVANQGWVFGDADVPNLAKNFKVFFEGLKSVQFVLTNGYQGHFQQSWNGSWDRHTLSAMLMVAREQKEKVNGAAHWCPAMLTGLKSAISTGQYSVNRADGADPTESEQAMMHISNTGLGPVVASAINTYAFSTLFHDKDFVLATRLLELAYLMDVPRESWNALSNWGIALYITHNLDAAEEKFLTVIESGPEFGHDEPYAYLSAIAKLRGDLAGAKKFDELCQSVGGYGSPIFDQLKPSELPAEAQPIVWDADGESESVRLTKGSAGGLGIDSPQQGISDDSKRAKFCSECGVRFQSEASNFCTECGTKRA